MLETKIFDAVNKRTTIEKIELVDFLFDNLQQYGDPLAHIRKVIVFSLKEISCFDGCTIPLSEKGKVTGVIVVNLLSTIDFTELNNSFSVLKSIYSMTEFYSSHTMFDSCDFVFEPKALEDYGVFDMDRIDEILEIGYPVAKKVIHEDMTMLLSPKQSTQIVHNIN